MGLQRFQRPPPRGLPGRARQHQRSRAAFSEIEYGGHNQTLRYDGIISPSWLIEASVARATNKFTETPAIDEPIFTDLRFVPSGVTGGDRAPSTTRTGKNLQFALKSTNIFNAGGNHQFRYGVQYEDIEFIRDTDWTGSPVPLADGRSTIGGVPVQVRTGGGRRSSARPAAS